MRRSMTTRQWLPAAPTARFIPRPQVPLPEDPHPAPPAPAPAPPAEKTLTQTEVNAIAAREKASGEQAALAKVAEQLGMSVEDAAKAIKANQDRDRAAMSEAERREAEAADKIRAAEARESAAALREHTAAVRSALRDAGLTVPEGDTGDALGRAAGMVQAPAGADEATIKAEVDKLKGTFPALFGTAAPPAGGTPSDPGRGPAAQQVRAGEFGKDGDAEFERRFGQAKTA